MKASANYNNKKFTASEINGPPKQSTGGADTNQVLVATSAASNIAAT